MLGAIGIRGDGTIVMATNGEQHYPTPAHHCEARLVRKLDYGAVVYVARTLASGAWAMAKPCPTCQARLRAARVSRVFYTEGQGQWGTLWVTARP